MRKLSDITEKEITKINNILSSEYYYCMPLISWEEIQYQCFSKSKATYSGYGVVKVYEYLKKVGINIL